MKPKPTMYRIYDKRDNRTVHENLTLMDAYNKTRTFEGEQRVNLRIEPMGHERKWK